MPVEQKALCYAVVLEAWDDEIHFLHFRGTESLFLDFSVLGLVTVLATRFSAHLAENKTVQMRLNLSYDLSILIFVLRIFCQAHTIYTRYVCVYVCVHQLSMTFHSKLPKISKRFVNPCIMISPRGVNKWLHDILLHIVTCR